MNHVFTIGIFGINHFHFDEHFLLRDDHLLHFGAQLVHHVLNMSVQNGAEIR